MDKPSKYHQVLIQRHLDAKNRLNKARDLYRAAPTEFEPAGYGRVLWENYQEALVDFAWLDQLLRDQGIEPAVDPQPGQTDR